MSFPFQRLLIIFCLVLILFNMLYRRYIGLLLFAPFYTKNLLLLHLSLFNILLVIWESAGRWIFLGGLFLYLELSALFIDQGILRPWRRGLSVYVIYYLAYLIRFFA
jgi:hypothetical protein